MASDKLAWRVLLAVTVAHMLIGCRLPGDVKSTSDFWKMMINKGSGQTPKVPSSRFNIDAHFHQNNERPGSFGVLGGYFLKETLQEFDPSFFGITPVEAMWMDPQQRKLLEVVYETFESAGVTLNELSGSDTACFIATFTADFQQMSFKEPSFRHSLAATGVDPGIISNRISHVFNIKGPSIVVNTACSSSVYAMHNACNALRTKECSAAVVGGVNLVLTVDQHMNTAKLGVLSPTSTCHTFNSYANGYGRAEGVGAVYLKRLSDAIRDGNPIRGLLRSSATNNNGKVPAVGITHPSFVGQQKVIKHAYERGGQLDPRLTGYFECHGTGTAIGDPLEVHAVAESMNQARKDVDGALLIGAVKTNIGHSEAASGLSAVIKAILTVERGIIPPTHGITELNPAIDWKAWQVKVPNEPTPFPTQLPVKRVSVNSFGYGGTNAHVIVESADSLLSLPQSYKYSAFAKKKAKTNSVRGAYNRNRPFLLPFSAHDRPTLRRNIEAHRAVIDDYDPLDLSFTLANCRTRFVSRGMVVTNLANLSYAFDNGLQEFTFADKKKVAAVGFVFTGQGAQWPQMGAELMAYYPSFLRSIRQLDMVLEDLDDSPEWTLEDLLLEEASISRVSEAQFSQPLCTAVQIALVQMLHLWNIKPSVTCGHSSGEIAAAYAAGFISASEAIVLAYYRGKVVGDINTNGAMLAVGLGADEACQYIEHAKDEVVVACHNSPSGVTLSGNAEILETIEKNLTSDNIFARLVKTNGKAYHSHHMQPAAEKYEALVRRAKLGMISHPLLAEKTKMVSSVTNSVLPINTELDEVYWSSNLLNPVLFNQAIQTICTGTEFSHIDMLIEVGPHSALSGPVKQIKAEYKFDKLQYLPTLLRGEDCASSMLRLAGELFLRDHELDLNRVTAVEETYPSGKIWPKKGNLIVDLPPYQWDKTKTYWAESRESREHRAPKFPRHDVLGSLTIGASMAEPTWRNILRIKDLPWLKDHSLGGEAVFPAAGYFSMAIEAITQLNEIQPSPAAIEGYVLRDVSIQQALVTPDDDNGIEVLLNMRPSLHGMGEGQNPWWDFNVSSISEDGYRKDHMAGSISINTRRHRPVVEKIPHLPQRATGKAWNQALKEVGFNYGPTFQDMDDIRFDGKNYVAYSSTRVKAQVKGMAGESRYIMHPACLDSCLQLMIVAIWAGRTNAMTYGAVPVQADEVAIWKPTDAQIADGGAMAFSWINPRGVRSFNAHNQLIASDGQVLMEICSMRCSAYEAAKPQRMTEPAKPQPYKQMNWKRDVDSLSGSEQLDIPSFVELADFKQPGLKVLAIGAKYAEALLAKVPALDLTVTEESVELTERCKQRMADYQNAKAQKLEFTQDLQTQSIKSGSYDLIVASIHSKADLAYLRPALVNGGRAIFAFATPSTLDSFKITGFLGVDVMLEQPCREEIHVARAGPSPPNDLTDSPISRDIHIVYRQKAPKILQKITNVLEGLNYRVVSSGLEAAVPKGANIVMLADFESPLLPNITEQEFLGLQQILSSASKLLWISAGGLLAGKKPEFAMASGLMRSFSSEQMSTNVVTIDFDKENTSTADIAHITSEIIVKQTEMAGTLENEYCVSEGKLFISRLVSEESINSVYSMDERDVKPIQFDPVQPVIGRIQSGKVIFEADNRVENPLEPDAVEIEVLTTGLNREDVLIIAGTEFPTEFSHEIGGIVRQIGSATRGFKVGDRVVGFSFDKFATYQRVHQDLLQRISPQEPLAEMTSLPMAYAAALHGLRTLANLQSGENVLILPGSGLAGAAAIRVSQATGAYPIVVVGSESEAKAAKEHFGLDIKQIIVGSEIPRVGKTNGHYEVDVIFSAGWVDPSNAREAWRHISPFGRFINCGRKDAFSRSVLDTVPIQRGANYLAFDLLELYKWKAEVLAKLWGLTISLYRQNLISPPQLSTRNITELNGCVAAFSDSLEAGKTIILHEKSHGTLQTLPSRPRMKLRPDATYFLVGALGGLGRSLTLWMMKKGARNFAFLSRSGADSKQASILVDELKASGANVQVFRGDAGVKEDLENAIKNVPATRPIRGVIQAAMVLRACILQHYFIL